MTPEEFYAIGRANDERKYREFWAVKSEKEAHDKILEAEDWDSYTKRTIEDILTPKVKDLCRERVSCLEIGCGMGRLMKAMTTKFREVHGIDMSREMLEYLNVYLKDEDRCYAVLCDGQTIPYAEEYFDLVYSVIVFQHIPYRDMIQSYIREIKRVLQPEGVCRIQTHKGMAPGLFHNFHGHLYPDLHTFASEFTDAGLNVIEMDEVDNAYLWITAQK